MGNSWQLNTILIICALAGAIVLDFKTRRVDNRFVLAVFFLGVLAEFWQFRVSGLWLALTGFAAACAIGYPIYKLKVFGGGDLKLILAVSPMMEWRTVVAFVLLSFFWGAIFGVVQVVMSGKLKSLANNMKILSMRQPVAQAQLHTMPYTVALAFGFLSSLTLHQIGWEMI